MRQHCRAAVFYQNDVSHAYSLDRYPGFVVDSCYRFCTPPIRNGKPYVCYIDFDGISSAGNCGFESPLNKSNILQKPAGAAVYYTQCSPPAAGLYRFQKNVVF